MKSLTLSSVLFLALGYVSASGSPLTQAQAQSQLEANGIYAYSSGGCTDRTVSTCTSYDGILSGTVNGVIAFKNAVGVSSLTITGGTEVGHASGTYSHANGYKVDVRHDSTVDNYIHSVFTQIADRGDGYPQWQASSGNLYCLSIFAAAATFFTVVSASGTPLTQAQAEAKLIPNGITAHSSGGCTDRTVSTCTSYQGILSGTVDGVITLKKASGVGSLVITGGTEVGHASGTYSHANGYKVDVQHQSTLDNYIHTAFTKIANRGDGYPQWQAASGNIYCDEGTHWDITYY